MMNIWIESVLSVFFPLLGVHLTSLGYAPMLGCFLDLLVGGSSDYNLFLLMCFLASNVQDCQN